MSYVPSPNLTDEGAYGWLTRYLGELSGIGLPENSTSNAFENLRGVKSGAGTLYGFSGFNSKAAAQFVLAFDLSNVSAAPANGTIPVIVVTVPASSNFSYDAGRWGRAFHAGIILCNSSTSSTLTIGLADCWFDAQYV